MGKVLNCTINLILCFIFVVGIFIKTVDKILYMENEKVVIKLSNINKTFRIKDRDTSSVLAKVSNIFNQIKLGLLKLLRI
jgi:hypothetical protein